MSDVTQILSAIEQGDANAADKLLPLVYEELRKLAAHRMANEAAGQTLQATALVHEAWLRLVGKENPKFENRAHVFAAAAEAMRRILIDNARRKRALRHGGVSCVSTQARIRRMNSRAVFRSNFPTCGGSS